MAAQMAADGGLRRLFEKPLPENPTLLEALSAWNHRSIHPKNPVDPASFTEIFGELHFQEKPDHHHRAVLPPPSSPAPAAARQLPPPPRSATTSWADAADQADKSKDDSSLDALLRPLKPSSTVMKRSASFCMKSLLLCTEGLGSESTVDADDMFKDGDAEAEAAALGGGGKDSPETDGGGAEVSEGEAAKATAEEKRPPPTFPPPIRSIGRVGKPSVCFRSFRTDGRFVLMEVVIPGKELLQAYREGGRLRLQFADGAAAATGVVVHKEMHGQDQGEGKELCMNEAQC